MMASRLTALLNKYERNYNNAYVTWYEEKFDNFLEPQYNPEWILEGSPEIDWYKTSKHPSGVFVMKDGSVAVSDSLGVWHADYQYARH